MQKRHHLLRLRNGGVQGETTIYFCGSSSSVEKFNDHCGPQVLSNWPPIILFVLDLISFSH